MTNIKNVLLFCTALASCTSPELETTSSQAMICLDCPPVEDVTTVYPVGQYPAPTHEQLAAILEPPPEGSGTPTREDMLAVSQSTYDLLPISSVEAGVRPGGTVIGCVLDWNQWTCWATIGGRTYYCKGTAAWLSCGSFSGGWR